jgi:hypothetical protein
MNMADLKEILNSIGGIVPDLRSKFEEIQQ